MNALRFLPLAGAFVLTALLAATGAAQTEVSLHPVADATIYAEGGANGTGDLFAGNNNQGNARRALLRFDLSAIPADATITAASVTLTIVRGQGAGTNTLLLRVTTPWTEGPTAGSGQGATPVDGDVTWTEASVGSTSWNTAGGDFAGPFSASTKIPDPATGSITLTRDRLIADVQAWVDGSQPNYGWFLWGNENGQTAMRYFSRESMGGPETLPRLDITYAIDPEPDPLADSADLGEGWFFSPWLRIYNPKFAPWLLHAEHGFLFLNVGETVDHVYFYDAGSARWFFTNRQLYRDPLADPVPNGGVLYDFSRGSFVWYLFDTGSFADDTPREFIDLESGEAFVLPVSR